MRTCSLGGQVVAAVGVGEVSLARSALAKINERRAAIGEAGQHESAAAQISREGMGDGEREAHGDCGVYRVASRFEDRNACIGREGFFRYDHGVLRTNWIACVRVPRAERRAEH